MRNPCKPAVQSTHLDDTNNHTNTPGALASPGWIHLVDQLLQLQDPPAPRPHLVRNLVGAQLLELEARDRRRRTYPNASDGPL